MSSMRQKKTEVLEKERRAAGLKGRAPLETCASCGIVLDQQENQNAQDIQGRGGGYRLKKASLCRSLPRRGRREGNNQKQGKG